MKSTIVIIILMISVCLNGCAWVGMAAAGFVGTIGGNLVSDAMQGKNKPEPVRKLEENKD